MIKSFGYCHVHDLHQEKTKLYERIGIAKFGSQKGGAAIKSIINYRGTILGQIGRYTPYSKIAAMAVFICLLANEISPCCLVLNLKFRRIFTLERAHKG